MKILQNVIDKYTTNKNIPANQIIPINITGNNFYNLLQYYNIDSYIINYGMLKIDIQSVFNYQYKNNIYYEYVLDIHFNNVKKTIELLEIFDVNHKICNVNLKNMTYHCINNTSLYKDIFINKNSKKRNILMYFNKKEYRNDNSISIISNIFKFIVMNEDIRNAFNIDMRKNITLQKNNNITEEEFDHINNLLQKSGIID
jgi:hypothetical protein